ncbi:hypothetical protein BDD12DRAFT_831287 [Trichophaea hybrida]|nr:hypothetical protein BDD12DRAFT_831287 [Trichophaea hybrida]
MEPNSILLGVAIGTVGSIMGVSAVVIKSRWKAASQRRKQLDLLRRAEEGRSDEIGSMGMFGTQSNINIAGGTPGMTKTITATASHRVQPLNTPYHPQEPIRALVPPRSPPHPPIRNPIPNVVTENPSPAESRTFIQVLKESFERLNPSPEPPPVPENKAEFGIDADISRIEMEIDRTLEEVNNGGRPIFSDVREELRAQEDDDRTTLSDCSSSFDDESTVLASNISIYTNARSMALPGSPPLPLPPLQPPCSAHISPSRRCSQVLRLNEHGYP